MTGRQQPIALKAVDSWWTVLVVDPAAIRIARGLSRFGAVTPTRVTVVAQLLAIGSAAGLGIVETIYAAKGRIDRVYLTDALVEGEIAAAWAIAGAPPQHARRTLAPPL